MYNLKEDHDLQVKFAFIVKKFKTLKSKKNDLIKSFEDVCVMLKMLLTTLGKTVRPY